MKIHIACLALSCYKVVKNKNVLHCEIISGTVTKKLLKTETKFRVRVRYFLKDVSYVNMV
jgi:hypothetical protein